MQQVHLELMALLRGLELQPWSAVPFIHAAWLESRRADGWVFGPASRALKTSPYVKPLATFTTAEFARETALALNDIRGILDALERLTAAGQTLCGSTEPAASPSHLCCRMAQHAPFVRAAAPAIHEGWRRIAGVEPVERRDSRTALTFDELAAADQAVTLENVRLDLMALASMLHGSARTDSEMVSDPKA